jgi:HEAT repeat protein
MKRSRQAVWGICISMLLITTLLLVSVPWPRVKLWTLIECTKHGSTQMRQCAALFLGNAGGDPEVVVPVLLSALQDKNVGVREMAALSLGHIHQYPEQVVPALLTSIAAETMESLEPNNAVYAVSLFGTNARPWSPILAQMIESNRFSFWSSSALNALHKIDPEADARLVQRREFMRTNTPSTNQSR